MYYHRQSRSSEPSYSGLALPTASRIGSWANGSAGNGWENIHCHNVELFTFLSILQHPTERSVISDQATNGEKTIEIIDLSDDEDKNISRCTKLVPEINKQLTTSELAGNSTRWMSSNGMDQACESMLARGDKNTQIVPYDQGAALLNHLPLQTSWQPSVQFEKVVLQKRSEEARIQDLVVCTIRL
jgi:hypothetical protein